MNESKDVIFSRIWSGLGRGALPENEKKALTERLSFPKRCIQPARVRLTGPKLVAEFVRMTTGEATTVFEVERSEEVPEAAGAFLREHGLPNSAVIAPEDALMKMPWEKAGIRIRPGRAVNEDITGITGAFAGIAETGCMLLLSGLNHPYTLNFLPENQIVVLKRGSIVATPEDGFDLIRKEFGPGRMPRAALMAAGPSRSADIGTSLQFGAHGPKRLHCILIR